MLAQQKLHHVVLDQCSCMCRSQRILQAKADKLAKRLEEEHGSMERCKVALNQQHAEQIHVLKLQLAERQQEQVGVDLIKSLHKVLNHRALDCQVTLGHGVVLEAHFGLCNIKLTFVCQS